MNCSHYNIPYSVVPPTALADPGAGNRCLPHQFHSRGATLRYSQWHTGMYIHAYTITWQLVVLREKSNPQKKILDSNPRPECQSDALTPKPQQRRNTQAAALCGGLSQIPSSLSHGASGLVVWATRIFSFLHFWVAQYKPGSRQPYIEVASHDTTPAN